MSKDNGCTMQCQLPIIATTKYLNRRRICKTYHCQTNALWSEFCINWDGPVYKEQVGLPLYLMNALLVFRVKYHKAFTNQSEKLT